MKIPEALNCPNCGGSVESDKTRCEFCRSRLKTVGCSKCLGMMFLGSKYCGHCGSAAHTAELLDDEKPGKCPRCSIELDAIRLDAITIRECGRCAGIWSGTQTFEQICIDHEKQSSILRFTDSYVHPPASPASVSYVPCPDCGDLMNRSNFARSSGVILDLCKQHGVWFDGGELPKIVEFIEGGGLDRARSKEKMSLRDEQARLKHEQLKLHLMARRSGGFQTNDNLLESGAGGLIAFLFDL